MLAATDEEMEGSSVPCLIERALTILISMASHGRPKSLKKLENVLRPCTMVAPHVNPLKVLEIANRRSQQPEPPVVKVQHNKVKVSLSTKTRYDSDDDFELNVLKNVRETSSRPRAYDLALPGRKTHDEITRSALAWLRKWETREGTKEQLVQGLFEHCQKKVERSSFEIVLRLQSRGFLKVHEGRVSYCLPEFDEEQSRVLSTLRCADGSAKSMPTLLLLYERQCKNQSMFTGSNLVGALLEHVYKVPGGYSLVGIEKPNNDSRRRLSSCSDAAGHHGLGDVFTDGIEDVLWDIYAAYVLSRLLPENRPDNLSDLIDHIEPESLVLAVPPRHILHNNLSQVKLIAKKSRGDRRQVQKEVVIGMAPGETNAEELIPLTPEGLLGIHRHITTSSQSPDPKSCVPQASDQTTPMDSPPSWHRGDKRHANGLSRAFGATLFRQLTSRAKNSNAVPVAASRREKEKTISRILEWLDEHASPSSHDDRDDSSRKPQTIVQLQMELLDLCAIRPRRISPRTIVRCLQERGYVTVHSGESPEVTYNITDVRPRVGLVPRDSGQAPWQQHAEEFRQSVSKCHSVFFKRAFPRAVGKSRPTSKPRFKTGKRRREVRTRRGMNKKLKHV